MIDPKIREDFPLYKRIINKKPIIYMDSACMTLKPRQVIACMDKYYDEYPACSGRSSHALGKQVTEEVEKSRITIQKFINARNSREIIFTKNTTESINLIANGYPLQKGDVVLLSDKEHNSVLIPFLKLRKKGIIVKTFKFGDIDDFKKQLTPNVKLIATALVSNIDGTSNPINELCNLAHKNNSLVLGDGAQSIPYYETDVRKTDIDFLAFSGHKLLGPTGTGVLYGKMSCLEKLDTYIVGGSTVKDSYHDSFEIEQIPQRFEAGLQNYSGILGLAEAIRYIQKIGTKNIRAHVVELNKIITAKLVSIGAEIIGPIDAEKRGGIISFNIKGISNHEIAEMLNTSSNIMIRSGMHCAHSWFNNQKINGSARISLYIYNTKEEVNILNDVIMNIAKLSK
ncbi:MAG: aminotransferase class V-fold PLP-dependent enzyme [Candidatus Woesearchaeota archaeon]